jgi:hypothetical protein
VGVVGVVVVVVVVAVDDPVKEDVELDVAAGFVATQFPEAAS